MLHLYVVKRKKFQIITKDTVITCFVNTGTCLLAGVVTFSILGHMAHNQGVEVEDVVNSGPGLVFITYPEVVLKMAGGSVWAVVFFSMLVIIGIDSEFCIVESLVTGIVDMYPETLRFANLFKVLNLCTFKITFFFNLFSSISTLFQIKFSSFFFKTGTLLHILTVYASSNQ